MKKLLTILIILLLINTIYCQDNYINPDGDVVSLTILQNLEMPNYQSDYEYDNPVISWSFLLKYPTSDKSTLLIYYKYASSKILAYDYDRTTWNSNTIGIGATLFFK